LGSLYHLLVEDRPTNAEAGSSREAGFHMAVRIREADSPQNLPITWSNHHA
jgi:hypothetical protein